MALSARLVNLGIGIGIGIDPVPPVFDGDIDTDADRTTAEITIPIRPVSCQPEALLMTDKRIGWRFSYLQATNVVRAVIWATI